MFRYIIAFFICFSLFVCISLLSINKVSSQDEEEEQRAVHIKCKNLNLPDALEYFTKVTGFNIVAKAGIAEALAQKGITVTMRLRGVHPFQAVHALAEYLNLSLENREGIMFLGARPDPKEAMMIGKIQVKGPNYVMTLNVYEGDIPYNLKRNLIRSIIGYKLTHIHKNIERLEEDGLEGVDVEGLNNVLKKLMEREQGEKKEHHEEGEKKEEKKKGDANKPERNIF
jgi:hypothetical protein